MRADVNCRGTIELFAAFVDGQLSAVEKMALRKHLKDCPRCAEFLESYRGTSRIYREATRVEVPEELSRRLFEFLAKNG